ncbi:MAG TPA: hypothetical protein PL017_02625 [Tenuifilaceae bacterium]|nr:hypothetical protein [Tenuifilaceae bacterium]HPE17632.1 hypothetical protein [Tenuifilaceae bacterium]HPJ44965.1 hypothetical protein [Tenuifilaceae bacterium]HPQ33788.1 hypothetical protein [Tenuifilaceae bacterium]HRX67680.1 hypothetical protein [Tenuifilaceae bacterium]
MKRIILGLLALSTIFPIATFAQIKETARAAELAFANGERKLRKGEYKESAQSFEVVLNNIPEGVEVRKYAEMRLDAIINLIDIYFHKSVNLDRACELLDSYSYTLLKAKSKGVLKGKDLVDYQKREQEYSEKRSSCEGRETLDKRKEEFEKVFEEATKE